jgi:undecaprenyl-diphosphatase
MGYSFEAFFMSAFSNLTVVGTALLITGVILFSTRFVRKEGKLDYRRSFLIGIFQGLAITPGISRSGATIGAAVTSGVNREKAVGFSFLLFIPAIIGAMLFLANDVAAAGMADPGPVALGMITAIIVGYLALRLLIRLVINRKFHWFALYCWVLGLALLVVF